MLEDALKYPLRGEESTATLLIGGGLAIAALVVAFVGFLLSFVFVGLLVLPFALVPGVLVQGYLVAVVRRRLEGDPDPPTFEDWSALFVDGLKMLLVGVVYAIPVVVGAVFVAVVVGVVAYATRGSPNAGSLLGFGLTALVSLALLAYGVLVAYVYPASVANWVREDDLSAAFSLSALRDATLNAEYLVAWLLALAVAVVGNLVGQALVALFFLGFFVLFYVQVVAWYCYVEGYANGAGLEREFDAGDDDGSAYGRISYEAGDRSDDESRDAADADEWGDLTDATERVDGEDGAEDGSPDERDGAGRRDD